MAAHRLRTHAILGAIHDPHDDPAQLHGLRFLATRKPPIKHSTQDAKISTNGGSGGRREPGVIHGAASGRSNTIGPGCIVPVGNGARMVIGRERTRRCQRSPDLPAFTASPRPSTAPRRSKRRFLGSSVMMSAVGPPAGMLTPATPLPAGQQPRHDANWRIKLPIKIASGRHAFAGQCSRYSRVGPCHAQAAYQAQDAGFQDQHHLRSGRALWTWSQQNPRSAGCLRWEHPVARMGSSRVTSSRSSVT
jgi:hypothetical protein